MKLAIGAGSGGGISGISTTGGGAFLGFATTEPAAGLRRALAARAGGRGFALRALVRFAFAAVFRPDFRDGRAFDMGAYATVVGVGRQRRVRAGLKKAPGDFTLPLPAARRARIPCSTCP